MMGLHYTTLLRADIIGVTLSATVGFFSMICVFVMFLIMFRNIYQERRANPSTWRLIKEPVDIYILLLFLGDIIQGLGYVLNIKWLHTGMVVEGAYCTAQGGIQQFGETGVAMTTLVIAIHSFVTVWWRKGVHNLLVAWIIMAIVWLYVLLFVVGGITARANKDYIIPDPFWCWISPQFKSEQIFGEYLWFWLTLFFSFLIYIPLYFCSRGNIIVSDEVWWKFSFRQVQNPDPGRYRALGLLAYPIVYSVLVLPLNVVRLRRFYGKPFPKACDLIAVVIFELSGAFNVLLLLTTRMDVLLFNKSTDQSTLIEMAPLVEWAPGHEQGPSMHVQTNPQSGVGNDPPPPPLPPKGPLPPCSSRVPVGA